MQNTPKESLGFSPAKISASPGSKVSQGKNLTGIPRLVRDNAVDVHSSIQQWNKLYEHGIPIIKNIVNTKVDKSYPGELKSLCEDLDKICCEMDKIVENLGLLADRMEKIAQLPGAEGIIFTTWPMSKYISTVQEIHDAYKKEASVKRIILENVAHEHKESIQGVHQAAWLHQPFISDSITTNLEAMLIETKLR